MSGPKIIRIVTREEITRICKGHLARLDAALARWERELGTHDLISKDEVAEMRARRDRIAAMLENDRFLELQKAAPAEIAFLEADAEDRITRETERQTRIRTSSRRIKATALTLIGSLEQSTVDVPYGLIERLRVIAEQEIKDAGQANTILLEGFGVLSGGGEQASEELSENQKRLVAALGDDKPTRTLNDWLAGAPNERTTLNERIDTNIVRLMTEFGEGAAAPFVARLEVISAERNPDRRRLLSDTLALDLAGEMTKRKNVRSLLAKLEGLDAELRTFTGPAIDKARSTIASVLETGAEDEAERALSIANDVLTRAREALAAAARHTAVLTELSRLGYEVREGMSTALAERKQVVIQKASSPEYGVEVFAGSGERLQVRAVAFGKEDAQRDQSRDKDIETIWCSEFGEIAKAITDDGGEVAIDITKAAGEIPIKIVAPQTRRQERSRVATKPRTLARRSP